MKKKKRGRLGEGLQRSEDRRAALRVLGRR